MDSGLPRVGSAPEGTRSSGDDTIPKLLLHHARVRPNRPAMREKRLGIWHSWTWREVESEIRRIASALSALGFQRGDRLAVIGDNRPLLYWSMVAAQALGGAPVPLHQDAGADEIADALARADVRFVVAEDQEQVDKLIRVREWYPCLEQILYTDPRGLRTYRQPFLHELAAVVRKAAEGEGRNADFLTAEIARGSGADPAGIYFTSGTNRPPKAVVLSFDNVLATSRAAVAFEELTEREDVLAYLPMACIGDHLISIGQAYCTGFCVNCPESRTTVMADLREIGPTYFLAPPRIWDNMRSTVTLRMEDAGPFKRWLYGLFMRLAERVDRRILDAEHGGAGRRLCCWFGERMVYGPLKNALGMSRVRLAYTWGEAISPGTFDFIRSLGINIKQIYGPTEGALFVTVQSDREASAEAVGRPLPGVALRIGDEGEVLFRGAGAFQEYCKDPTATLAAKTADGWIHSGDAGFIDTHGDLHIVDRVEEAGHLTDGTVFAPMQIENRFRAAGPIREILIFGHGREYVAAFVTIDGLVVGHWAERQGLPYTNYRELAQGPEVRDLVRQTIEAVNREMAQDAMLARVQVRRFLVLEKEFDPDDGELTRSRKLRRQFIAAQYAALVDMLYADEMRGEIDVPVAEKEGGATMRRTKFTVVEAAIFRARQGDAETVSRAVATPG